MNSQASPTAKQLAKIPLALPRRMIETGFAGADKLTDVIPADAYDDNTVYILFHGNANASYAVMERILKKEVAFSLALERTIKHWSEFNREEHYKLVGKERNFATHQNMLPRVHPTVKHFTQDDGSIQSIISHWYKEKQYGDFTYQTFFGEWMMEVWVWWKGRINQLDRMYKAELERSGNPF